MALVCGVEAGDGDLVTLDENESKSSSCCGCPEFNSCCGELVSSINNSVVSTIEFGLGVELLFRWILLWLLLLLILACNGSDVFEVDAKSCVLLSLLMFLFSLE